MAPSSQLNGRMVGMRVEVMLPRDAALRYANLAVAAQDAYTQPSTGQLPVLTCRLQTDFSSHVQAAQCRPWQVWLIGTDATCDAQWERLQPQAGTSQEGVSGPGIYSNPAPGSARCQALGVVMWCGQMTFSAQEWYACWQCCFWPS